MNNCIRCDAEMKRALLYRATPDGLVAAPGYECLNCGMIYLTNSDEWQDGRADPAGEDEEVDDTPPPDLHGGHVGFYTDDGSGSAIHVLGDPNMSNETLDALRKLAQAAKRMIDRGEI